MTDFVKGCSEYGRVISPYSVRMRENVDQNNSEYGHFLRSQMRETFLIVTHFARKEIRKSVTVWHLKTVNKI